MKNPPILISVIGFFAALAGFGDRVEVRVGAALDSLLAYWRDQLGEGDGIPTLTLPVDRARGTSESFRGERADFRVPGDVGRALRALGRKRKVTLYMLLLAAFKTLLFRYTHHTDILVSSPIAGAVRLRAMASNAALTSAIANPSQRFREALKTSPGSIA